MTQSEVAIRLGITQQTLSALERNAKKVSADRLLALLSILGVELVMRKANELPPKKPNRAGLVKHGATKSQTNLVFVDEW